MIAVAQPFLYNAPTKVTSNWFAHKERPFATMVGTCANILGVGLGFLLPGFMVSEFKTSETYTDDQLQSFRDQIRNMLIVLSVASSVITLICGLTFQE